MFKTLFGRKSTGADPQLLYGAVVARARAPEFYRDFGVPDTFDGRFEMVALHVYLVLRRLKREGPSRAAFSQVFFDAFIDNMAVGLREAGVGDQVLPKRLQKMSRVFYGRAKVWDAGFAAASPENEMIQIFNRNLHPDEKIENNFAALARYVLQEEARLGSLGPDDILSGSKVFPDKFPNAKRVEIPS